MTSLFNGMAGVLGAVFGAPVTYRPQSGPAVVVQGVFRRQPIEVAGENGEPVWIMQPSLRVQRDLVPLIRRGDLIEPSIEAGAVYRIVNRPETASPAPDGFIVCALELVP